MQLNQRSGGQQHHVLISKKVRCRTQNSQQLGPALICVNEIHSATPISLKFILISSFDLHPFFQLFFFFKFYGKNFAFIFRLLHACYNKRYNYDFYR
jgi:hypothetical protein